MAGASVARAPSLPARVALPAAGQPAPERTGLIGAVGGFVLLLIVICGVAAFCSDVELLRRAFGCCAPSSKVVARDEGEAFLSRATSEEERLDNHTGLHPGLDAAFRHVEKLEANMLRKPSR